jgi:hypothetical protein
LAKEIVGNTTGLGAQVGQDVLECMMGVKLHLTMVSAPGSDGPDRGLSVVAWRVPHPAL